MRYLQQLICQAYLIHDLHDRGMYCITSEVSVKVHVLFEKYNRNAFTRQEQGKDGTGWAAPYDTAGCLFYLLRLGCLWSYLPLGLVLHIVPRFLLSGYLTTHRERTEQYHTYREHD